MNIEIVKMSSKGQFVMPAAMRKKFGMGRGERLVLVEREGTIIVRPVSRMSEDIESELCLMDLAGKGWAEIEAGKAKKLGKTAFLKELSKW
ncbi:Antidote-toxin recognition MazE, bacterial antitoxin [uncultured archaeon]|nr:Antidote-toxin recognition MazE, bacterial antitoxin [uncultured archaeon]